ncbi:hypothetical protein P3T37_005721 [Kitasatospora sp. MAA4]|uniref:hypothetical protein n=1 Tax=Kitasatospora sp. MAA4 TaxID=3035093 RepID=UPI002473A61D|nr:hypothetical protein [Kitasatospora sp. MAA4]MDH6136301.1 hypothetical protein [Kitasatospora sp. MAA4]
MTQPSTARDSGPLTASDPIPAQRTALRSATTAARAADSGGGASLGWAAEARRAFAIVRGLRSLATVPARPQASYGECDGQ